MKEILAIVSAMMLVFVLVACNSQSTESTTPTEEAATMSDDGMGAADPMATEPTEPVDPMGEEGVEAPAEDAEGEAPAEGAEEPAM